MIGQHHHIGSYSSNHRPIPCARGHWLVRIGVLPDNVRVPAPVGAILFIVQPEMDLLVRHCYLRAGKLDLCCLSKLDSIDPGQSNCRRRISWDLLRELHHYRLQCSP